VTICQVILCATIMALSTGCSQYIDPNVPEQIRPFVEPEHGRDYLLYRPSNYDRERAWPLIIVCHTSFPDSPNKQIRAWTELAESRGFLVAAPKLRATSKSSRPKAAARIRLLRQDEDHILATIQHIRAGHTVSDDRVFIHGWAGGAHAALHAGLRHPELFRAISLIGPKFKSGYLVDVGNGIDHYQPIFVNYSVSEALAGKQGSRCVDWLRSRGANLHEDPAGLARKTDTAGVVDFLEDVIRKDAWIRIGAFPTGENNPLEVHFKLRCSYTPLGYRWEFGDGDESTIARPIHVYAAPGTYRVAVTTRGPNGREDHRTLDLKVP
jgi:pimeloyl-ACP methyl ester carboxylesterase